ncbi:hypothetical protein HGG76_02455 [Ochrobactrum tritici]|nr:hypothetical protein [Brucella tritici]
MLYALDVFPDPTDVKRTLWRRVYMVFLLVLTYPAWVTIILMFALTDLFREEITFREALKILIKDVTVDYWTAVKKCWHGR